MTNQLTDGWPELTYRYIEHYFWEPQHLLRTERSIAKANARGEPLIEAVYRGLRTQEVPLNHLLNVLLRITPSSIRHQCLGPFGIELSDPGLASLSLKTPCEFRLGTSPRDKVQPDVHLESETTRVFIELKVGAPLKLEQIKKYVCLHAKLDEMSGYRRPYVLLLVKRNALRLDDVKQSFAHDSAGKEIAALLGSESNGVTFGSTTWAAFSQALAMELERRRGERAESVEMLEVLIGDFLADLEGRGLLSSKR